MEPFDRYVRAWNAGELEEWVAVHHPDVEYVSLALPDPRVFRGHEGLREVWRESRANWQHFRFSILDEEGGVFETTFTGLEMHQGTEISGVLWFRVECREGRIVRLWSALDAGLLPAE